MTTIPAPPAPPAPPIPGAARLILIVLVPFGAGYFMSYLFRNINAVVGKYLIADIGLGAADIGLLTAAYFFTFALFQVPLGVLLDRFGPRRVNATLLCVAALGAVLFSFARDRDTLALSRSVIGLGVSGCLMSSFQAITHWFPKRRWPLLNGILLAIGGMGAMAGTGPIEAALRLTHWRGLFLALGLATLAAAVLIFFVAPDRRSDKPQERIADVARGMKRVLASRAYWSMVPMSIFVQSANLGIIALWAGLWLRDVPGFDRGQTAWFLFQLNLGLTIGFVAIGMVGDWANRRGISLARIASLATVVFFLCQAAIIARIDVASAWPWILFGIFSNGLILAYPLLVGRLPVEYSGRVNTLLNFASFGGAFLGQYAIGWVIDFYPRTASGQYPAAAYDAAFGGLLVLEILGFLWFLYAYRRA